MSTSKTDTSQSTNSQSTNSQSTNSQSSNTKFKVPKFVLKPDEMHRGRSYSEWIESWANLLVSGSPDYPTGNQMRFLRGNIDYKSDEGGSRFKEPGKFFDKTGNLRETIYSDTAVLIPIVTALYTINEPYEGRALLDEEGLRYAVRKDITEGGKMWLRIKSKKDDVYKPVVDNLEKYYFESAKFTLNVSRDSPLVGKFEYPLAPNNYEAVQGGYFVILHDLPPDTYRLNFGGFGRGFYYTASVYDIKVMELSDTNLAKDISQVNKGVLPPEIELNKYFHLKIEKEIDESSPF